jgi:hypothetical protein
MFGWRVTCTKGGRRDETIECASNEEAELVALFVNLGKVRIDVPTDQPIIAELLPRVRTFCADLDRALDDLTRYVPDDLRPALRQSVMRSIAG